MDHTQTIEQLLLKINSLEAKNTELENYKARSEQLGDAMFISDFDGNILDVNDNSCLSLGYTREELLSMKVGELDNTYITLEQQLEFWNKLTPEKPQIIETTHKRKNDTVFPVEISISLIELNDKKLIIGFARDITERKQAENSLRMSERKFAKLFQTSPNVLVISTLDDGRIIDMNDQGISKLGYKRDEIIGKTRNEINLVSPEDIKTIINSIKNDGYYSDLEINVRLKDGSKKSALFYGQLIEIEGKPLLFQTIVDITSSKKAEKELQQSEKRFRRLFEGLGDAVYVTIIGGENRGQILEVNNAAEQQTGYSRSELLKMNIINDLNIIGSGEISTEDWEEKLKEGNVVTTIEKKRKKDDKEIWTEVIVTAIDFKGEKASLSINHDITERKRIEEELKEYREHLEELVEERTIELENKNKELFRMNELFIGREFRIKELRDKVKKLESALAGSEKS